MIKKLKTTFRGVVYILAWISLLRIFQSKLNQKYVDCDHFHPKVCSEKINFSLSEREIWVLIYFSAPFLTLSPCAEWLLFVSLSPVFSNVSYWKFVFPGSGAWNMHMEIISTPRFRVRPSNLRLGQICIEQTSWKLLCYLCSLTKLKQH